jgi:DNA-binding CsgD family transcriptional regulator
MGLLNQSDLRPLLKFMTEIYSVRGSDEFIRCIVSGIPKLIPSKITTYDEMETSKGRSKNWGVPEGIITPEYQQAWERVMLGHPVLRHFQRTGESKALRISDFQTASQFHGTALYKDHCRPLGVEDELCLAFAGRGPVTNLLALHRGRQFSERDRLMLDIVGPHIIQAWRNAQVTEDLKRELRLVERAVAQPNRGAVLLSGDWRVRFATDTARKWLADYFGACRGAHRLPELLESLIKYQTTAARQARMLTAPSEPLVVHREGRHLVIGLLSDSDGALLILEEQETGISPSSLRSLGLTRRESEVLAEMAMGKTDADIAATLGMSPKTVHKHLEHIYRCLNVQTRTAAAAKAFQAHQEFHAMIAGTEDADLADYLRSGRSSAKNEGSRKRK